ncbi:putative Tubulin binding cofactor C [Trypanosoma vivax]|nr:putative Tubulin binding cofactor C [Trypanosoma vivax]
MDFDDPTSNDEGEEGERNETRSSCTSPVETMLSTGRTIVAQGPEDSFLASSNENHALQLLKLDQYKDAHNDKVSDGDATSSSVGSDEDHFHHQLVYNCDPVERPFARHGGCKRHEGRLGVLAEDYSYEHDDGAALSSARDAGSLELNKIPSCPIEDTEDWEVMFSSMVLVDVTMASRLYVGSNQMYPENSSSAASLDSLTMIKTLSLFSFDGTTSLAEGNGKTCQMAGMQPTAFDTIQRIASHMLSQQQLLQKKGLTDVCGNNRDEVNASGEESNSEPSDFSSSSGSPNAVCRGVQSVRVDSAYRLIGIVDMDTCTVSLADVIAYSDQPFSMDEILAVIKSVVIKTALLHDGGFVHGCLHAGNVLCSTDNGHTLLTSPCGIMCNPLLPSDPSFISPRHALKMQPLIEIINANKYGESGTKQSHQLLENEAFNCALLSLFGCGESEEFRPSTSDDVYAIGVLTLSCLVGAPPFCTTSVKDTVNILASLSKEDAPDLLRGDVFSTHYMMQRFQLAGYTPVFIELLMDFVSVCLRAGVGRDTDAPVVAGDLLEHSLLAAHHSGALIRSRAHSLVESGCYEEMEEQAGIDQIIHCLVYPIYTVMECMRTQCGTSPFLSRLSRNSIFAARLDALRHSPLCSTLNSWEACSHDAVHVVWPYLDKRSPQWSVQRSFMKAEWYSALYNGPGNSRNDDNLLSSSSKGSCSIQDVAKITGVHVNVEARALVYSAKSGGRIFLRKGDVPHDYLSTVDTLVLVDLSDCFVEILASFRYVILINLKRCRVRLAPCYFCYCESLVDCRPVSLASCHLVVHNITSVCFCLGPSTTPRCRDSTSRCENVVISPYDLVYCGLSADLAAVPLPQEHAPTAPMASDATSPQVIAERSISFCEAPWCCLEYPYSHALAAFGSLFVHEDDGHSDVFLYFSEVKRRRVRISRIHGGTRSNVDSAQRPFSSEVTRLPLWKSRRNAYYEDVGSLATESLATHVDEAESRPHFPIIFIMDIVSDCVVQDCSDCTIVIMGSTEVISLKRCSNVCVFLMAREIVFEDCQSMEAFTLVTELLVLHGCSNVTVSPLAVEAPHVDDILMAIIDSCTDESLREGLKATLREKDIYSLNALLRFQDNSNAIELQECDSVHLNTECQFLFSVDFVHSLSPVSTFFRDALCEGSDGESITTVPLLEHAWMCGDVYSGKSTFLPPLRLHDLVNVTIPRTPGTLTARQGASSQRLLAEVILERILTGTVHIADAIETLFVRKCTGPLDIVVGAATQIIMESCDSVTLHAACRSFTAVDCHACNIAICVNTSPCYVNCTNMQCSTANLCTEGYERLLARAGIEASVNCFDKPLCKNMGPLSDDHILPGAAPVDSLERALMVLGTSVVFVPPPPLLCLSGGKAPLLTRMAECVEREEALRAPLDAKIIVALLFITRWITERMSDSTLPSSDVFKSVSVPLEGEQMSSPIAEGFVPERGDERHVDPISMHPTLDGSLSLKAPQIEVNPCPADARVGESLQADSLDFVQPSECGCPSSELAQTAFESGEQCPDSLHSFDSNAERCTNGCNVPKSPVELDKYEASESPSVSISFGGKKAAPECFSLDAEKQSKPFAVPERPALTSVTSNAATSGRVREEADVEVALGARGDEFKSINNEYILAVHPDEAVLVRSVMQEVAEEREAYLALSRAGGATMRDLEQRVSAAISWLRGLSH